jgi:hypothetical protein
MIEAHTHTRQKMNIEIMDVRKVCLGLSDRFFARERSVGTMSILFILLFYCAVLCHPLVVLSYFQSAAWIRCFVSLIWTQLMVR